MSLSRLEEFINIYDLKKYDVNSKITFKNGEPTGLWFKRHKQEIYEGDDDLSHFVRRQHQLYLLNSTGKRSETNASYVCISPLAVFLDFCQQFANCPYENKFRNDYEGHFETKEKMGRWFIKNQPTIFMFAGEYECCTIIKRQWEKFKNSERVAHSRSFFKNKISFVNLPNPAKFSHYSIIKLPSGELSGLWFEENKMALLKDEKIKEQYIEWYIYDERRNEFYDNPDYNKFNLLSNLRFSDGVLMGEWWETNKEDILRREDRTNRHLAIQYAKFVSSVDDTINRVVENLSYKDSERKKEVCAKKA